MIRCPYCNKQFQIEDHILLNLESYRNTLLIATDCCKRPVTLHDVFTYRVKKYHGSRTEDDWGVTFKTVEKPRTERGT